LSPILYEINTRQWLRELSQREGRRITLSEIPDSEIERWRKLGFTHIWLMGVWQIGPQARAEALKHWRAKWRKEIPSSEADVEGSPYAIQEYSVDPRLGEPLGLLMLKERLGRAGFKLIVDFVPNHFGLDCAEPERYPARFVQASSLVPGTFERQTKFGPRYFAHGRDPYFAPWTDTVQLDYRVAETQEAVTATAQTISMYGHGLRCDMAMLLLPEIFTETWRNFPSQGAHQTMRTFWKEAIPKIRSLQPHVDLIAEVYWDREQELQELGFDYTYNKRVYDFIVRRQHTELNEFLSRCSPSYLDRSVHFIENHDEPRAASLLSIERHKAAAALLLFLPGMALLHEGQLEGRTAFARIQITRRVPEEPDSEISHFYGNLLSTIQTTLVRRGKPTILRNAGGEQAGIFAVKWEGANGEADVAVVNLGEEDGRLTLKEEPTERISVLYSTKLEPVEISTASEGCLVRVPAESAYILRVS
jgi:hypothetical protein